MFLGEGLAVGRRASVRADQAAFTARSDTHHRQGRTGQVVVAPEVLLAVCGGVGGVVLTGTSLWNGLLDIPHIPYQT